MGLLTDALGVVDKQREEWNLTLARESVSQEKEKEYCLWVKPTEHGWAWLEAQTGIRRMDVLIPILNGRCRARASDETGSFTGELSNKYRGVGGSDEVNSEIGIMQVLGFYSNPDYLTHVFKRITVEANEDIKARSGTTWDIDIFYTPSTTRPALNNEGELSTFLDDVIAGGRLGEWVKVELNVESFQLPGITDIIPFGYSESIPSRTQDPLLQEQVRHYWDVVTAF